tara:strand:- start:803 stop:1156 length:354 start_codon:yes stop_codon:yes gene_type:complete
MPKKLSSEQREILKKQLKDKKLKEKAAENLFKKKGRLVLILFLIIQSVVYRFVLGLTMGLFLMIVVYFITAFILEKRVIKNKVKNIYIETLATGFLISLFLYSVAFFYYYSKGIYVF